MLGTFFGVQDPLDSAEEVLSEGRVRVRLDFVAQGGVEGACAIGFMAPSQGELAVELAEVGLVLGEFFQGSG